MIDQNEPGLGEPERPGSRGRLRAAALGLLALAALIVAVTLFNRDDETSGAAEEGDTTVEISESVESSAQGTTEEAPPASESQEPTEPQTEPSASAPAETEDMSDEDGAPAAADAPLVLITSSGWNSATQSIEVVGSVQGVATETSTCTATAVRGDVQQQASVSGTFDGQGTSCGLISIAMPGQPSGAYSVTITFDSGDGPTASEPVDVLVP